VVNRRLQKEWEVTPCPDIRIDAPSGKTRKRSIMRQNTGVCSATDGLTKQKKEREALAPSGVKNGLLDRQPDVRTKKEGDLPEAKKEDLKARGKDRNPL